MQNNLPSDTNGDGSFRVSFHADQSKAGVWQVIDFNGRKFLSHAESPSGVASGWYLGISGTGDEGARQLSVYQSGSRGLALAIYPEA